MKNLEIFKIYLIIYFLYGFLSIYLAVFMGVKIPIVIDLIPLVIILLRPTTFRKFRPIDFIFLIFIVSIFIFLYINKEEYSWIENIEIRNFILICINYCLFRILIKDEWSENVEVLVVKIIELSMYIMLIEFVVININDNFKIIENAYLNAYPERQRLYENIIGFSKPIGLYTGTHSAGIAATISLLYLKMTNRIKINIIYFIASFFVYIICFSLTSFLALIITYLFIILMQIKSIAKIIKYSPILLIQAVILCICIIYYEEITTFRSSGVDGVTKNIDFKDAQYVNSVLSAYESLKTHPFGTPINEINFNDNEVYVSRIVIIFGIPILIFLITIFLFVCARIRNITKNKSIYLISLIALFISSFHYPAMIFYPLNILMPLSLVFIFSRQDVYRYYDNKK